MNSKEHTYTCVICGGPTVAGTTVCPSCETHTERWMERPQSEYRFIYDNQSHDGLPSAVRFLAGPYKGQTMKVVAV